MRYQIFYKNGVYITLYYYLFIKCFIMFILKGGSTIIDINYSFNIRIFLVRKGHKKIPLLLLKNGIFYAVF